MMKVKKNIYIKIRENLKDEHRHMAIPQFGSAVIVANNVGQILLLKKKLDGAWVVPGGVQELGENLRYTAKRELLEETGIDCSMSQLELIDILSEEGRHHVYPNGDEVYNNTALFALCHVDIDLIDLSSQEYSDHGDGNYQVEIESVAYQWFSEDNIPDDMYDEDLVKTFYRWYKKKHLSCESNQKKMDEFLNFTNEDIDTMIAAIDVKLAELDSQEEVK